MGNCGGKKASGTSRSNMREQMFEQMTILQDKSAILQKPSKPGEKVQTVRVPVQVKQMTDATSAIRKSYRATNVVLGQGAYGKVFLFKSKNGAVPE